MRFDVVIMNPPYSKTLHLDILSEVIPHAKTVCNISPTGWLEDCTAVEGLKKTTFQKYEHSVAKYLQTIKKVEASEANKMFGIGSFTSVSIQKYEYDKPNEFYRTYCWTDPRKMKSIFDKVIRPLTKDKSLKWLPISTIHGHPGQKDEFDIVTPEFKRFKDRLLKYGIGLTEDDMKNIHASLNTKFMKYCNLLTRQGQHIMPQFIPYVSKALTDIDYYEHFKLTQEEIDHIEKTMTSYMWSENKYE